MTGALTVSSSGPVSSALQQFPAIGSDEIPWYPTAQRPTNSAWSPSPAAAGDARATVPTTTASANTPIPIDAFITHLRGLALQRLDRGAISRAPRRSPGERGATGKTATRSPAKQAHGPEAAVNANRTGEIETTVGGHT